MLSRNTDRKSSVCKSINETPEKGGFVLALDTFPTQSDGFFTEKS
jgi:hypothetical protein